MSGYTCISCGVSFSDPELQRAHYKGDWHRYNLKRKVAELPPITAEAFQQKLLQQRSQAEEQTKHTSVFCKICGKVFSSENAYSNHLNSKKHKTLEVQASKGGKQSKTGKIDKRNKCAPSATEQANSFSGSARDSQDESVVISPPNDDTDDDEWEDIEEEVDEDEDSEALPPNFCLFCPHESISIEDCLRHMTRSHSFFIPDIEYLIDLEGFLVYLGSKVGDGKVCLYCNQKGRNFYSIEAVQKHMADKGHCKIDFEGDAALEFSEFYDFSSSYPDHDANSSESSSDLDASVHALRVDQYTMELLLPSGARAGHRSLRHYFKQSVPPEHLRKTAAMIKGIEADYKALGWHGTMSETTRHRMEAHKIQRRRDRKNDLRLKLKANKMQKFFRPQVVF